jgi:apolipoprotein N-acyltransferase
MPLMFGDRLWIVRKRVLAFEAVFFGAAAMGALLVWYVSDAKADPGPVVYLFPVVFAIIFGAFPALAYFLNKWIKRFEVTT